MEQTRREEREMERDRKGETQSKASTTGGACLTWFDKTRADGWRAVLRA